MRRLGRRLVCHGVLAAFALGILGPAAPALAGKKGRQNTAKALTGVAAYHLFKGHGPETVVFGGAAYYAWQRAKKSKRHRVHRHRHRRAQAKTARR